MPTFGIQVYTEVDPAQEAAAREAEEAKRRKAEERRKSKEDEGSMSAGGEDGEEGMSTQEDSFLGIFLFLKV